MCQIDLVGLQTCETIVQPYVVDYLFAITTGTYQKIEASVNEIVQNGMFSLFKEQLKAKSPFNKDVISKIEKEFERYNTWKRHRRKDRFASPKLNRIFRMLFTFADKLT